MIDDMMLSASTDYQPCIRLLKPTSCWRAQRQTAGYEPGLARFATCERPFFAVKGHRYLMTDDGGLPGARVFLRVLSSLESWGRRRRMRLRNTAETQAAARTFHAKILRQNARKTVSVPSPRGNALNKT